MSKAAEAVELLDASDVEEITRDLRRRKSVAGSVVVKPAVEAEPKRGPKKRIPIPADDVRPAPLQAAESSWVTMLYPADLNALVDEAFSPERLARVPAAPTDDDGIDVDIELDEVASVERQEATSGVIGAPRTPTVTKETAPRAAGSAVESATPAAAVPPPAPSAPPPPPKEKSAPPPTPKEAGGPPPVPLSAFTGESEKIEAPQAAAPGDAKPAAAPPPVPGELIEPISDADADESAFDGAGSTSVDEVQPLSFPDDGTPPPIPIAAATPLAESDGAATGGEAATTGSAAPGAGEAPPPSPPQIPSDAQGGARPAAASGPPAVPAPPAPAAAPKKKRPKKFKKPWFEEFFDDDYLRTIPFMTPSYTVKEMGYIRSHLNLPDGAKLLDVGCGYGRLAIEFARVGYEVTGLDTSLPLMFKAAEASTEAGVEVNFMHQDMREMSFDSEFDAVYCVMTSFGYFDDETNRDVVGRMFRALKPGGKLFIEVINRDFILNDLPSRVWWEGDDCVVMDEVEFNFLTSRIVSKRSVVFSDGRSVNHDLSIRAYCLHELGRLLHNAGFRVSSVTGNINTDNRFFGQHSPYLIVLSEKQK